MPAYIVVQVTAKDAEKYEEYGTAWNVQSFMEDYGGEFIMMSKGPKLKCSRASGAVVSQCWNVRRLQRWQAV